MLAFGRALDFELLPEYRIRSLLFVISPALRILGKNLTHLHPGSLNDRSAALVSSNKLV